MISTKKIFGAIVLCFTISSAVFGADEDVTRRLGMFIGSNNGGSERTTLRYAVSDARVVSRVFSDMGGINPNDNMLLVEPSIGEINKRLDFLREQVLRFKQNYKRTEIVFYYSGHSDEEGLLLNRERYAYRALRERINAIPSDVRIVILDSCSSGAFTRTKGGVKTKPFLMDNASSAEGYAFLSSSSASEDSQESDRIASSYFTHSLVAGLRGAADMVGDGRVTLNEAYRFAYTETLAKTETSIYGTQHPSYDIQVNGTGDLVLTDVKETSAGMVVDEAVSGRLSIRDSSDYLIAEITKTAGRPMELGLEPGLYRITLQQGNSFFTLELRLEQDRRTPVRQNDFTPIAASRDRGRTRGNGTDDAESFHEPFSLQFVPSLGIPVGGPADSNTVLIGILGAYGKNLHGTGLGTLLIVNSGKVDGVQMAGLFTYAGKDMAGVQAAALFNYTGGDRDGVQAAGVFNYAAGNLVGVQTAGLFNYTGGDRGGVQVAGFLNYTSGDMTGAQISLLNSTRGNTVGAQIGVVNRGGDGAGAQIGLVNVSDNENVVPIGLVNVVKNGMIHPQVFYDDMGFTNLGFKSGSKHFYSVVNLGVQKAGITRTTPMEGTGEAGLAYRGSFGFGYEFSWKYGFFDIDILSGGMVDLDDPDSSWSVNTSISQVRLTAGFKALKHLGVFAGLSYDYAHLADNDPKPGTSLGDFVYGWSNDHNVHKLGFFAGIQF
ncbi:caspase family protein [Treponema primitia]|uniref:LA_2272 family surface repeat-containing protein n=1 Tax=Treponema primitia TaxID=88058 RepID=UPI00397FA5AF